MLLPIKERRGFNREQAIAYLGVKGTFFDKKIRPKLNARKVGSRQYEKSSELKIKAEAKNSPELGI